MKRTLSILLAFCCLFHLAGCGSDPIENGETDKPAIREEVISESEASESEKPAEQKVPEKPEEDKAQAIGNQTLPKESTFSIHFIDVGQGDAALA